MTWYVVGAFALLAIGIYGLVTQLVRKASDSGRAEAVAERAKADTTEAVKEAGRWADRPRALPDAAMLLRARAARKRKGKPPIHP